MAIPRSCRPSAPARLDRPRDHRQHEQGRGVGHRGGAHDRRDRAVARQPHLPQQRIGHQRVRAPVGPHQHRRRPVVAQQPRADDPERERDREREQREGDRRLLHLHEQLEVELEPGAEHQVEQAELAERRQRDLLRGEGPRAVRPQRHARQDQADHRGQPKKLGDLGRQNQRQHEDRVGQRRPGRDPMQDVFEQLGRMNDGPPCAGAGDLQFVTAPPICHSRDPESAVAVPVVPSIAGHVDA